ncbi:MgtC/SapB family protein [Salegentibacter mishustinae]|uniref:MgtC/SapB family protein n=1 Tax=Salegentibacter mishustinae TaxID=270918 RepID=UPI000DB1DE5B|nr:MgtC/SapB family protein [Salegentibacter mishustinae]PZX63278.1 putative Mg2+ transporter-C (MgtC) family protein [Salegentibacter mishustinae]GGW93031.1 hypothetical protein GCM10008086_22610 [Salegentibacter mishustinae]
MDWTLFALRVGLATAAGLIIGLEREIQGKEAGLKTNALVSPWSRDLYFNVIRI